MPHACQWPFEKVSGNSVAAAIRLKSTGQEEEDWRTKVKKIKQKNSGTENRARNSASTGQPVSTSSETHHAKIGEISGAPMGIRDNVPGLERLTRQCGPTTRARA